EWAVLRRPGLHASSVCPCGLPVALASQKGGVLSRLGGMDDKGGVLSRLGGMDDKAVDNALAARLVEVDGELVAVHLRHLAVAELPVDPRPARRVARTPGGGGEDPASKRAGGARLGGAFAPAPPLGALPAGGGVAAGKSGGGFLKAAVAVGF